MNNIEYRKFEIRYDNTAEDSRTVSGLAIPVESRSQLLGGMFYETINRNAVTDELIRTNDVRLFIDHLPERGTLARSKYGEGSLRLFIEDDGLHFSTELPHTSIGDEILVGIRRGDFDAMSFGMIVDKDEWTENTDGTYNREIRSFSKLVECSILSQAPAYLDTDVAIRSLNEFKEQRAKEEEEEEKEEKETEEVQDEVKNEDEVKDEEKEEKSEDEVENEDDKKEEKEPSEEEEEERKKSILKRLEELRTEINSLSKV